CSLPWLWPTKSRRFIRTVRLAAPARLDPFVECWPSIRRSCGASGSHAASTSRRHAVRLRDVAHGRAGDKGRLVNLSVIAFDERDFSWLVDVVTVERVRVHLGLLVGSDVRRYLVPGIGAINFV